MKLGELKSVGHNISDSFASGIGLLIGLYEMDVFAEAAGEPEGFVVVDFLAGSTKAATVSASCREAIGFYRDALPELCAKHGIEASAFARLEARVRNRSRVRQAFHSDRRKPRRETIYR
jgi:hypothetical protein